MPTENKHAYILKYKTVDSLFSEIEDDLSKYDVNGMIDRSKLIRTVQRCNALLGLKINQEKEVLLGIDHFKAELPADFFRFNYAVLCTAFEFTYTEDIPKGSFGQFEDLDEISNSLVDPCQI